MYAEYGAPYPALSSELLGFALRVLTASPLAGLLATLPNPGLDALPFDFCNAIIMSPCFSPYRSMTIPKYNRTQMQAPYNRVDLLLDLKCFGLIVIFVKSDHGLTYVLYKCRQSARQNTTFKSDKRQTIALFWPPFCGLFSSGGNMRVIRRATPQITDHRGNVANWQLHSKFSQYSQYLESACHTRRLSRCIIATFRNSPAQPLLFRILATYNRG